ncbi:hypothetical protein [Crassaminicella profunda]|uniref:hypothetical protein n=1 Tax=Crassaminicella profunda TaxID=1286698 RepID=UPI001CA69BF3|nr:hypothetical protein [Crassaminicella profunda]QZY54294.1 hypothetical protein K7H06_14755 [Crassaminicella profunda]
MKKEIRKKITPRMVQKAYSLDYYDVVEKEEGHDDLNVQKKELPEEFFRVMGKILTFVERADEEMQEK